MAQCHSKAGCDVFHGEVFPAEAKRELGPAAQKGPTGSGGETGSSFTWKRYGLLTSVRNFRKPMVAS